MKNLRLGGLTISKTRQSTATELSTIISSPEFIAMMNSADFGDYYFAVVRSIELLDNNYALADELFNSISSPSTLSSGDANHISNPQDNLTKAFLSVDDKILNNGLSVGYKDAAHFILSQEKFNQDNLKFLYLLHKNFMALEAEDKKFVLEASPQFFGFYYKALMLNMDGIVDISQYFDLGSRPAAIGKFIELLEIMNDVEAENSQGIGLKAQELYIEEFDSITKQALKKGIEEYHILHPIKNELFKVFCKEKIGVSFLEQPASKQYYSYRQYALTMAAGMIVPPVVFGGAAITILACDEEIASYMTSEFISFLNDTFDFGLEMSETAIPMVCSIAVMVVLVATIAMSTLATLALEKFVFEPHRDEHNITLV